MSPNFPNVVLAGGGSRIEPVTDDELKHLFDALQKENAAAHAEMRRDFRETADRHVAESISDLQARVERLESSTH